MFRKIEGKEYGRGERGEREGKAESRESALTFRT